MIVQIASKTINGTYFKRIEAKQAIPAPIKFSRINAKLLFEILPVTFKNKLIIFEKHQ